jgi:3-oxoacyl-(acyl-carrier-protein) synthase
LVLAASSRQPQVGLLYFSYASQNPVGAWYVSRRCYFSSFTKIFLGVTALQSLAIACDTLLSGQAKVMITGGFDDISEEGSFEFVNMKATSSAETEFAMGREPTKEPTKFIR